MSSLHRSFNFIILFSTENITSSSTRYILINFFFIFFFCREYNLIGVLMGLAVYNSIILDLHFPSICYRKLLTPPVVPQEVGGSFDSGTLIT